MQVFARRAAREAAIGALFVAAAVAMTWPLAIRLSTSVSDLGDPLLTTWILDWTCKALLHDPLHLFSAPVFYPAVMPLAYSEHFVGVALLVLPFHAAGATPLTVFNLAMLLGFALSGYGAFVLARMYTSSFPAAFLGGLFYAFVSFKFDHVAHLQLVSSGWLPLILAALIAYTRRPTAKRAALFGAAFAMNGLTNVYYLLFAVAALAVTLVFLFFADAKRDWRFWARLVLALAIAGLVLLPFLLPYRTVSEMYNMKRPENELRAGSGVWSDWLRVTVLSGAYGDVVPPDKHKAEHQLFPGLFGILLFFAAIVLTPRSSAAMDFARGHEVSGSRGSPSRPRDLATGVSLRILDVLIVLLGMAAILGAMSEPRFVLKIFGRTFISIRDADLPMLWFLLLVLLRLSIRLPLAWGGDRGRTLRDAVAGSRFGLAGWLAALWIAVGILGSLGLNTFFYSFLFERIEAYQSMRAPSRFAAITYAGMVGWVAMGAAAMLRDRRGLRRAGVAAALLIAAYVDLRPRTQWEQVVTTTPPVYRWMASVRTAPVLEWPVDNWLAFRYLYGATQHGVMLMNGSSGFEPPLYRTMRTSWDEKQYGRVLDLAEANGCRLLIVHGHWLGEFGNERAVLSTLRAAVEAGRLQYLRRFDHGVQGDFVFAVTRNFRDWARLRAPDVPDGAAHFPREQLARFLRGEPTYSGAAFGSLEQPRWTAKGPLQVSGWAFSPFGIRSIYVLLEEGRHRFEAIRVPRPEISQKYGWYYEDHPGFTLVLPKRPRGVDLRTDVQIEIVDGRGRATRLEDQYVEWDDQ